MDETQSLLNQVLALRGDHSKHYDDRAWAAIELLAQRIGALSGEQPEDPIAPLTAEKARNRKTETWHS